MPIRRLPPLLVNQIAAGEVIERPANVVKELVDNAIDAGATRIEITCEQGGVELVRVADDGGGIPSDELELAVAAHATSKIERAEDLDAIATMGFRGEALASIASVSRLSILSRTRDADEAALIEAEGDVVKPRRPAAGAVGTTVTVRNLFFNAPARRKFLKTARTESGRIADIVEALALSHPSIAFTLRADSRVVRDLPGKQPARQRVLAVIGTELEDELIEVNADDRGIAMWGMAGRPSIARSNSKQVRVFLNGRPIVDRSITHAIREAYRGLVEPTRWPTILLYLEMEPATYDVNVHPTKSEVRFRRQSIVHAAVLDAVRASLRRHDLTPELDLDRTMPPLPLSGAHASSGPVGGAQVVEMVRRLDPREKGFVYSEIREAIEREAPGLLGDRPPVEVRGPETGHEPALHPGVQAVEKVLQVHSRYLVTQDHEGVVIIDQHALHERVMFEQLKARVADGALESQRMLMPATIDVDRRQVEAIGELRELMTRIGIEAEPIGPAAIAVHAFPSFLFERGVEPEEFIRELLGRAIDEGLGDEPEAALHEVLDMMACKAAIKAGDRLNPAELTQLVRDRERIERSSNCPHGRPTSLRLTIRDLDRQFGRS